MSIKHLFFDEDGPSQLREAAQDSKAELWNALRPEIEATLGTPFSPPCSDPEVYYGHGHALQQNAQVAGLAAFGYLIEEESRYLEAIRSHLLPMTDWQEWRDRLHWGEGRQHFELATASVCIAAAHCLDWCGETLTAEERRRIIQALEIHGAQAILHDIEQRINWFKDLKRVNNWVPVMCGGMGIAALLLWEEKPIFREALHACVQHIKRYLDWIHDDGSTDEAGGYWHYGMRQFFLLLDALRINRDRVPPEIADLGACNWHRSPKLARTAYFPLTGSLGTKYVMNFGDTRACDLDNMMSTLAWLAARFQDRQVQWFVRQLECKDPMGFIWFDPDLSGEEPGQDIILKVFDTGWAVVRSGLSDPDEFFFAFRGGKFSQTHAHWDLGNFVLWHRGQPLIADPGCPTYDEDYWKYPERFYKKISQGHNVVLVEGKGQQPGAAIQGEYREVSQQGKRIRLVFEMTSPANNIAKQRRSFDIQISQRPQVIFQDEIRLSSSGRPEWLFHFEGKAKVEDSRPVIESGPARLEMAFQSEKPVEISVVEHEEMPYLSVRTKRPALKHRLTVTMRCRTGEQATQELT